MKAPNKPHQTLLLFLMTLLVHATAGATIFVKWDAGGADNGSSWTDAYTDLQDALTTAVSGDTIWVAGGTYTPTDTTDRYASFDLVDSTYVYGGFAGTETSLQQRDISSNETILSGEIGAPGIADNSYNVVVAGGNAAGVLDGFTITLGNALIWGGGIYNGGSDVTYANLLIKENHSGSQGAGMDNRGQPTLRNVTFLNNTASSSGGGMRNYLAGNPVLIECTFDGNSAGGNGGAIGHNAVGLQLLDCHFSSNSATGDGGAICSYISDLQVSDCTFEDNHSIGGSGGGVYVAGDSAFIEYATFEGNIAGVEGGGIYTSAALEIYNAVFEANQAGIGGGVGIISGSCILANAVFYNNSASHGGGIDANNTPVTITNATFHDNTVTNTGGGMRNRLCNPQITNVIFWENSAGFSGDEIANFSASVPSISFSLIRNCGGSGAGWDTTLGTDGGNNIDANPLYVDAANGNLRLTNGSPAINAGDNDAPDMQATDLDGNPRILDSIVDMGAYEFDPATDIDISLPSFNRIIQNIYPNPFNPLLTIVLECGREQVVNLAVYDVRGRLVRILMHNTALKGRYSAEWDSRDSSGQTLASGVYFIVLRSLDDVEVRKVSLVK
jgi:predicted outer membrane repeat protein